MTVLFRVQFQACRHFGGPPTVSGRLMSFRGLFLEASATLTCPNGRGLFMEASATLACPNGRWRVGWGLLRWSGVQVGSACHVAYLYLRYVASAFQEAPCPFVTPCYGDDIGPVLARELHRVSALAIEGRGSNRGR